MSTRYVSFSRFGLVVVLLAMLIGGATLALAQDGPTSDPTDPLIAYVQAWYDTVIAPTNPVTEDDAEAFKADTFIWHDPFLPSVAKMSAEYVGLVSENDMRRSATNRQFTFDRLVRYGDLVWIQYTDKMTLQTPPPYMWAIEPWTHLKLPMELAADGVLIARIEDGRFAESWEYADSPLISYVHEYYLCNGWQAPLAAADLPPREVADVELHTLVMEGEKITLVQQLVERTINGFERDYGSMLKGSVIVHDPRGPEVRMLDAGHIRQWFVAMHELVPDFHMDIQHIVEHEDMVWVHWRSSGTLTSHTTHPGLHTANQLEMPHPVEMEGVYLFRFEDNRIAEWWWYEDSGLLTTVANAGDCLSKGF